MNRVCRSVLCLTFFTVTMPLAAAQSVMNTKDGQPHKFRQLSQVLPTPGAIRTASGAPGHEYWQQKVDYDIDVTLDDQRQRISGCETITYRNNSPDTLKYLWLQLDANRFHPESNGNRHQSGTIADRVTFDQLGATLYARRFKGGCRILSVSGALSGRKLPHSIVGTHMRVDLPEFLEPDGEFRFTVSWKYNIPDATLIRARSGFEFFKDDGNYIYEIAQWFPRLCVYSDTAGWQHKEFLGRGEFALEFGDYVVRITVPDDHIVGATGDLLNPDEVLTEVQRERLEEARTADAPVFVVTPDEAKVNETESGSGSQTWIYTAKNVRDFAFASSRKFIWDAWGHDVSGNLVMAMSLYPNEGEPLWSKYSTHAVVHTLDVYSKYSFPYPYPVAYSVNGPVGGMEYPMICFNGPRPENDGTYSERTKYGLISVIIHEVGHNYFPMIVNSDERQWTWMDEGLNTFLQYLSEVEWEDNYPTKRGEPKDIIKYMTSLNQVPIMTNSESILQFGNNAYSKPATALNILRESVLGREQFDFAFREYSRRWMFKRPNPADLFRTMEDASGVDLDWFWRGWFYTTDHVDIAITNVRQFNLDTGNPEKNSHLRKQEREAEPRTLANQRNAVLQKRLERYPQLSDFYNTFDELGFTKEEEQKYAEMMGELEPRNKKLLSNSSNFYLIDLENQGGLVMPVVLRLRHTDDTTEEIRLPAEIWVRNSKKVSHLVVSQGELASVELDPHLESADVNRFNNKYPPEVNKSRFQLYKEKKSKNEMQKAGLGDTDTKATQENSDTDSPEATGESS